MRTNPDVVNSISENLKDISGGWLFCDVAVYDPDYKEILLQPVSIESVTINYLRFKENVSNLIIRSGIDSNSPILWAGTSFNLPDTEEDSGVNSSAIQFSTGVVDPEAPDAIYGIGTITIVESHVNLYDNPNFQGEIKTYLVTSATFTLTDGTQQYIVADHNNGSPIYRLENNKSTINDSNIALIRIVWRAGNNVHSADLDSAGVGLGNKINDSIINTTPYRKSVDGGLTLSETSTPISRTVLITEAGFNELALVRY